MAMVWIDSGDERLVRKIAQAQERDSRPTRREDAAKFDALCAAVDRHMLARPVAWRWWR